MSSAASKYGAIESSESPENSQKTVKGWAWGTRHTFCLMTFLLYFGNQTCRTNISVAIVAMVSPNVQGNATWQLGTECPFPSDFYQKAAASTGTFQWNAQQQGLILGCFYYGYVISLLPGTFLAEKFAGAKWILAIGIFGGSVCSLLTPLIATRLGYEYFVALRIFQGLLQGPTSAVVFTLMGKWIPVKERSFLSTLVFNGTQFGTILTLSLSGILAEAWGWQSIFYVFGSLSCLISILWVTCVHEAPSRHPRISEEEKALIYDGNDVSKTQIPTAPYASMVTSLPVWALVVCFLGSGWGYFSLLNETPTYLNNIQHFNLSANGALSALPHLGFWLSSLLLSYLSDWLIRTDKCSPNTVRKIMTAVATYGPALSMLGLAFTPCNPSLAVFWLTFALTIDGAMAAGYNVNALELSPNYAGSIRGMASTIANIQGFLAPTIIALIIEDNNTLEAWKWVYILASIFYTTTGTFFLFFGSTKTQKWNSYWKT